jgi:hypothetical protein
MEGCYCSFPAAPYQVVIHGKQLGHVALSHGGLERRRLPYIDASLRREPAQFVIDCLTRRRKRPVRERILDE